MNPIPNSTAAALVAAVGSPTLARVQEDVAALGHLLSNKVIQREYLDPILRGEEVAVPELFSVARLARGATEIEPHAPGHRRRICDARVQSGGQSIYVEVKHQRDNFPFNDPGVEVAPGITTHTGTRPGVSHVAGVWLFRLRVDGSDQPQVRQCDWARGHLNPSYSGSSLPDELTYAIPNVIGTQD